MEKLRLFWQYATDDCEPNDIVYLEKATGPRPHSLPTNGEPMQKLRVLVLQGFGMMGSFPHDSPISSRLSL